jgi:hypothetical protein
MARLFPLRGFICPPRLFTVEAEIVMMLNFQNTRGSAGATPEYGPSGVQPTLNLKLDHLIGSGQNPNWAQIPADGRSRLSISCSPQETAK